MNWRLINGGLVSNDHTQTYEKIRTGLSTCFVISSFCGFFFKNTIINVVYTDITYFMEYRSFHVWKNLVDK